MEGQATLTLGTTLRLVLWLSPSRKGRLVFTYREASMFLTLLISILIYEALLFIIS